MLHKAGRPGVKRYMKPRLKIYWYQFKFNIGDVGYIYIFFSTPEGETLYEEQD
jgi:hypothetical protein